MEIRRAYQRLKQTFGTSQATVSAASLGGSKLEDIMQTIQEAYDVLGDPQLRELYRQNFDAV
jgi:curved DNA-binding protein CbpA